MRSTGTTSPRRARRGRVRETLFATVATLALSVTGFASAAYATQSSGEDGGDSSSPSVVTQEQGEGLSPDASDGEEGAGQTGVPEDKQQEAVTTEQSAGKQDARAAGDPALITVTGAFEGDTPLVVGGKAWFSGTWENAKGEDDNSLKAGDTFFITLPPELEFPEGQKDFNLEGEGGAWGTCKIHSPSLNTVTCTLTDLVNEKFEVKGTFRFQVEATGATSGDDVKFNFNGTPTKVVLPGEKPIIDPSKPKDEWSKTGELQSTKAQVKWTINLPGAILNQADGPVVTITDSPGGNQVLCDPNGLSVAAYRGDTVQTNAPLPALGLVPGEGGKFSILLTEPNGGYDARYTYKVSYLSCTSDGLPIKPGSNYTNEADIDIEGVKGDGVGEVNQNWTFPKDSKSGSFTPDNEKINWDVRIKASHLLGLSGFELTDTVAGDHEVCEATARNLKVQQRLGEGRWVDVPGLVLDSYTQDSDSKWFTAKFKLSDGKKFELEDPWLYRVTYQTCKTSVGVPDPENNTFNNSVTVNDDLKIEGGASVSRKFDKVGTLNQAAKDLNGTTYPANTLLDWTVTIPGYRVDSPVNELDITDTMSETMAVCGNPEVGSDITEAIDLKVIAKAQVEQAPNAPKDVTLQATATMGADNKLKITVEEPSVGDPDGYVENGFSKEYQYVLTYTTCTASGGQDLEGTNYTNSIEGVGDGKAGSVTKGADASGTGGGASRGTVAVTKSVDGDGKGLVPAGTEFTVKVEEIAPTGKIAQTYNLMVKADGTPVNGLYQRGTGWKLRLSEPTFPKVPGVTFGDPVFAAGEGITLTDDGKVATAAITPGKLISVSLTNTATADRGEVSITKAIEGTAAGAVSAERTFPIKATFQVPKGAPAVAERDHRVAAGETWTLGGLPVGTVVTFSETKPADTTGMVWGEPKFTPSNKVTVPTGSQAPVKVMLTNKVDWVLGEVSITKELTGPAASAVPEGMEFEVTASFQVPAGAAQVADRQFSLKAGQVETIKDLPVGTKVTFTEVKPANTDNLVWSDPVFSPGAGVTVAGPKADPVKVKLTNAVTYAVGGVTIQKVVSGNAAGAAGVVDREFDVKASFKVPTGATEVADQTFKLKAGELKAFTDLPVGTEVTFTEVQPEDTGALDWQTPTFNPGSTVAVISEAKGSPVEVVLTNEVNWVLNEVSITKDIEGPAVTAVPEGMEFEVTASFQMPAGAAQVADRQFTLKAGQVETIKDLPVGTKVTFTETMPVDSDLVWEDPTFDPASTVVVGDLKSDPVLVKMTNHVDYAVGKVVIEKFLEGGGVYAVDPDMEFTVKATFDVPEGAAEIAAREFPIKVGQPVTIDDLPVGTVVNFDEVQPSDDGIVNWGEPSFSETSVVVVRTEGEQAPVTVMLTNHVERATGTLEVGKKLQGVKADKFPAGTVFEVAANWSDEDGKAQSALLKLPVDGTLVPLGVDLPTGTEVTFTEAKAPTVEGFKWASVTFSPKSVTITEDEVPTVIATNVYKSTDTLPVTGAAGTIALLVSGLALIGGGTYLTIRSNKKRGAHVA